MSASEPPAPADGSDDRTIRIFVAERLIETFRSGVVAFDPVDRIGTAELMRFLDGDGSVPAALVNRALMKRPALRTDLAALRARLARIELPRVAAASSGELAERPLPGGVLTLFAPPGETFVYLGVRLDDPPPADLLLSLVLTTEDDQVLVLPLPDFSPEGTVMLVLDSTDAGDAACLAALRAPGTHGDFIERRGRRDD